MLWECILHRSVCGPVIFSRHRRALRECGRDTEVKEGRLREGTQDANEVNKIGHSLSPPLFNSCRSCKLAAVASWNMSLLTRDKNMKYTFELTNPLNLSCLGCLLASVFFWVVVLANRRLVEHRVEYKLHVEKPLDAASPLDESFDAVPKTRENLNKTGFLKSRRARIEDYFYDNQYSTRCPLLIH